MIKGKKYEEIQRRFDKVQGDMKGTWKILNSLLNGEKNGFDFIEKNGVIINDKKEIADEFNKFFVNSVIEVNNSIPDVEYQKENMNVNTTFEFKKVSISEVKKFLKEIKSSSDCFNISSSFLSDSMLYIGKILTDLINEMFDVGVVPDILKQSTIVPIQKISGTNKIEEFRPINTLPCIEKLIEKIAYEQLVNYVNENNYLPEVQSGFRKAHSCETSINYVLADWKEAMESNKITVAVFLDFKRAFETLDRNILLEKLKAYGIHGSAIKWFQSYLEGRKQVVKFNGVISDSEDVEIGVPQGAIMGTLLFTMYAVLKNELRCCKIKKI